jgi:hypothetical protein
MDEVRRPGGELTRWEQLYGRAFSGASDGEEDASEQDEQIEAWIQVFIAPTCSRFITNTWVSNAAGSI